MNEAPGSTPDQRSRSMHCLNFSQANKATRTAT